MLVDIIEAEPLEDLRLRLRFQDGVAGIVALDEFVSFQGIFAPLADQEVFARVKVNPELGTVEWPNGADLDPDVLYAKISGTPIPNFG